MHVWPAFQNFELIKPSIALVKSVSCKIIKGAFPPNSKDISLTVSAAQCINVLPTIVKPVKVSFLVCLFFNQAFPIVCGTPLLRYLNTLIRNK